MSTHASVLIGFTPTHLIPMLEIASRLPPPVKFFHPDASRLPQRLRRELALLGNCEDPSVSRASKYMVAALQLRRLLRRGQECVVCVPHPFNPLSNFAFFARGAAEVRIFQDGILNYYDADAHLDDRAVAWERRIKAAGALLPYRTYAGHLSGIDARKVSVGYLTHPGLAASAARFGRIERLAFDASLLEETRPRSTEPVTLFLDQPLEGLLPREAAAHIREQAYSHAESFGHGVLYKPHYTQRDGHVPRRDWQPLSMEERSLPAEEIPARRCVASVVSFCSSALVNIRLGRPSVHCVAVGSSRITIRIHGRTTAMSELLGSLGVATVDGDSLN